MIYDTIVIGTGLFGSLIARGLRDLGRSVLLVGDNNPEAGSGPAACLMNPAWTSKLGSEVVDRGLDFLSERFDVQHRPFLETTRTGTLKRPVVGFIRPEEMLLQPDVPMHVEMVRRRSGSSWTVSGEALSDHLLFGEDVEYHASRVVVAAGVWSQRLVPWYDMHITGKYGCAFLYPEVGAASNMNYWAPYRQLVSFDRQDGRWVNDGSAIIQANWTDQHIVTSRQRVEKAFPALQGKPHKTLVGIRPYTQVKPCLCEQVAEGLWVAVGAAKNGTLLGGYCASLIQEKSK